MDTERGVVACVSRSPTHSLSKPNTDSICLVAALGVEGDAHQGATVKHRSRVAKDPTTPNLRQVHLIHAELFDELRGRGFAVSPGLMGENVTTSGIDLLALPTGTRLHLGGEAIVEITGLRNPCRQLERSSARSDGRDARPRQPRQSGPQGRNHGDRAVRRGRARGRPDPGRAAASTASAAAAGLIASTDGRAIDSLMRDYRRSFAG